MLNVSGTLKDIELPTNVTATPMKANELTFAERLRSNYTLEGNGKKLNISLCVSGFHLATANVVIRNHFK